MELDSAILILLVIVGVVLFLVIFNIVSSVKRKVKRVPVVNGILFGIIVGIVFFQITDSISQNRDELTYNIYTSALLGSYNYERNVDGYYIVNSHTFMGSGGSYAIPEEQCSVSLLTKVYSPIRIYCLKDTHLDSQEKTVMIDSRTYVLADNVVKLVPEYFDLYLVVGLIDIGLFLLYNVIEFIVNIVIKVGKKKVV